MNSRTIYVTIVLAAGLAACSHSQEEAAVDYCINKFGYEQTGAQLSRCVETRKAQQRQFGTALMALGFGMMATQPPPPQPAPQQEHVCIAPNNYVYRC